MRIMPSVSHWCFHVWVSAWNNLARFLAVLESVQVALGIDFGLNTWGLATGNTLMQTATPLKALKVKQGKPDWTVFLQVMREWRVDVIILGLPLNMDGTDQPLTKKVRKMAITLADKTQKPVQFQDERLSTVEAKAILFEEGGYRSLQKEKIDSISAKIILEDWFTSLI